MKHLTMKCIYSAVVALAVGLFAPPAFAQYYQFPYLEAECPDTSSGGYASPMTSVAGFSGSGYLRSNGNVTAANYNNTSADHATYQFTTKLPANYVVWFRVNTNNSADDDSLFFQLDAATFPIWITLNNLPGASGWRWVAVQTAVFPLGAGTHTLEIANRENGINIDKIAILPEGQAAPSGAGAAAYNCPVAMYFETECRGGAYAAYQFDKTAKSGFSGGGYLESATNNTANALVDEATYFFETGAGAYRFYFRIHNNSNAVNDSWFYSIDNGAWVTMNDTYNLGSGWRWAFQNAQTTLTHGRHRIRIRNREAGLSIDRIAFVPTSATAPSGTNAGPGAVNCEPFQTMADWTPVEVQEYYDTHLNYFAAFGDHMLAYHLEWHGANGAGGTRGSGSGTAFMGFHRAMMNDLRRFALETNSRVWLPISTTGVVVPSTLGDAYDALLASGFSSEYLSRVNSSMTNYGIPAYLTTAGTPHANWENTVGPIGTSTYAKLGDFESLDALGQGIAWSYHGALHGDISGTMDTYYSPADPIFYGWHGLLDRIATVWLTTTKGQQWAAANPSHPFLVTGFTSHHGWDNADWDD
jgi:hypothetical protein